MPPVALNVHLAPSLDTGAQREALLAVEMPFLPRRGETLVVGDLSFRVRSVVHALPGRPRTRGAVTLLLDVIFERDDAVIKAMLQAEGFTVSTEVVPPGFTPASPPKTDPEDD